MRFSKGASRACLRISRRPQMPSIFSLPRLVKSANRKRLVDWLNRSMAGAPALPTTRRGGTPGGPVVVGDSLNSRAALPVVRHNRAALPQASGASTAFRRALGPGRTGKMTVVRPRCLRHHLAADSPRFGLVCLGALHCDPHLRPAGLGGCVRSGRRARP